MTLTKSDLIEFEEHIKAVWETGDLPFLVHLSGGNEDELIHYFKSNVRPRDWIFSSHRNHYHYLLTADVHGVDGRPRLEKMIRDGRSMFVYDRELNFLTSSVLAGTCCPAAGVAASLLENPDWDWEHVHCFVGDAAEDEGHFYEAVRYVHGKKLPCTYVIEDNDRSCDTSRQQRRGTRSAFPVARVRPPVRLHPYVSTRWRWNRQASGLQSGHYQDPR